MFELLDVGRNLAAKCFGAKKDEIAYIRCTNEGINIVANMIDWKKGDNVILNDLGYPSNWFPWMRQKSRGVRIKCLKNRNDGIWISDFEKLIDEHTKVIAIEHVNGTNGFKCDIEALGELAEEHGIYLVVDGAQSLGAIDIDLHKSKIDFLSAGAHKWLLGPTGIGLLYVREELLEKFEPLYVGPSNEERLDFTYHEYKLAKNAKRFEFGGSPNFIGVVGLVAALKFISNIGIPNIERRLMELTDLVRGELEKMPDVELPSWKDQKECRSQYIGFKLPHAQASKIVEALEGEKIIVGFKKSTVGETIRVAPYIFNTEEEIIKFVEVLKKNFKG
jgi:selenocysteine lyase/cysteine desulfurase